ncbi:711_t:CDS:2, partial [Dentiscutata erythropus]
ILFRWTKQYGNTTARCCSSQSHFHLELDLRNKVTALKLRGNILVTGSSENYLKVWNIKTGECNHTIDFGADVLCVDFLEDMDVIACGSYYGYFGCKIFSLSKGEFLDQFLSGQWIGTQCMAMNKEYIVLGTCKGLIHVISWADGRKVASFHKHPNAVAGVRFIGRNIILSVSTNGAIDTFNLATNEHHQYYISPRTSISTCAFDYQGEGRDLLCIAPSGSIFHLKWKAMDRSIESSQCSETEEDKKINSSQCSETEENKKYWHIFSQDPEIHYKNENILYRMLCAGIDAKYNHGVIGSLVSFPPKGHLLVYNFLTGLSSKDIICGPKNSSNVEDGVFNMLGIDEERVVAGCSRGFIYCFEFGFNDSDSDVLKEFQDVQGSPSANHKKLQDTQGSPSVGHRKFQDTQGSPSVGHRKFQDAQGSPSVDYRNQDLNKKSISSSNQSTCEKLDSLLSTDYDNDINELEESKEYSLDNQDFRHPPLELSETCE